MNHSLPLTAVCSIAALLLAGCGSSLTTTSIPVTARGTTLQGQVHGGQAPVSGASVYLMATSTLGYGTANTSLLKSGRAGVQVDGSGNGYVTTNATGLFTITSDYDCPSADTLVYIVALGGNPGLGGSLSNPAMAEVAALGPCGGLSATTYIAMNEVTTVAAMAALAPFTNSTATAISTSPTNILGLKNAFVTASNLVNTATGAANNTTPSGLGQIPYQEINTLADVLAACINSNGAPGSPCDTLFSATKPASQAAATNTMQAMLYITQHPAQNVGTLFKMVTATSPFQPTLPATYNSFTQAYDGTPNDWSLAIVYTGSAFSTAGYLALDSKSNVWAANISSHQVVQLSNAGAMNYVVPAPAGTSQLTVQNYDHVLAVDLSDNLWVDNNSYGISEITSGGIVINPTANWGFISGPGTSSGTVANSTYPTTRYKAGFGGIAVGTDNTIWYGSADYSDSGLAHVDGAAVGLSFKDMGTVGLRNPTSVAIDNSGNYWLNSRNQAQNGVVVKVAANGTVLSGATGFPANGDPIAIAIDHSNNAWIAGSNYSTLTALHTDGTPLTGSPFTGGGLAFPSDISIDGDGRVWVANFQRFNGGISEFDGTGVALSNSKGFYPGTTSASMGAIAIDGSGNVWVADWQGGIEELIGVGAPTVTPLVLATKNNQIGVRP